MFECGVWKGKLGTFKEGTYIVDVYFQHAFNTFLEKCCAKVYFTFSWKRSEVTFLFLSADFDLFYFNIFFLPFVFEWDLGLTVSVLC